MSGVVAELNDIYERMNVIGSCVTSPHIKRLLFSMASDIKSTTVKVEHMIGDFKKEYRNALKDRNSNTLFELVDYAYKIVESSDENNKEKQILKREWLEKAWRFGAGKNF